MPCFVDPSTTWQCKVGLQTSVSPKIFNWILLQFFWILQSISLLIRSWIAMYFGWTYHLMWSNQDFCLRYGYHIECWYLAGLVFSFTPNGSKMPCTTWLDNYRHSFAGVILTQRLDKFGLSTWRHCSLKIVGPSIQRNSLSGTQDVKIIQPPCGSNLHASAADEFTLFNFYHCLPL